MSSNNFLDQIDPEILISLVEARPAIWDKFSDDYKSKSKRSTNWTEVCEAMEAGFKDFDEKTRQEFAKAAVYKWKNLRDNFLKAFRNEQLAPAGSGAKVTKPYVYKKQMAFLKKVTAPGKTYDSSRKRMRTEEEPPKPTKTNKTCDFEETMALFLERMESRMHTRPEPEPPMLSFFKGVLPAIASFDEDQNLELQTGILALISRIKTQPRSDLQHFPSSSVVEDAIVKIEELQN